GLPFRCPQFAPARIPPSRVFVRHQAVAPLTLLFREPSDGGVTVTRSSGRPLSGLSLERPSASARNVEARSGRPLRARDKVTGVMPHASANSQGVSPPRATSPARGAAERQTRAAK